MAYIYILTNKINNKKYIGQTTNIKIRLSVHSRAKGKQLIHKAIKKYGWNNFNVEYFECSEEILDEMERVLISVYNTTTKKYGYNLESGGHKNKHHSEETKIKMSKIHSGKNHHFFNKTLSNEHKEKISKGHIGKKHTEEAKTKISLNHYDNSGENHPDFKGEKHPMYGKHHSEESKKKMSEALKGRIISEENKQRLSILWTGKNNPNYGKDKSGENNPHSKKVICIETGEIFNTLTEAAKKYNLQIGHICSCCNRKRNVTGGYHWMYYNEYLKQQEAS